MKNLSIKVFPDSDDHIVEFDWQSSSSDAVVSFAIRVPATMRNIDDIKSYSSQTVKELIHQLASDYSGETSK